MRVCVCVWGGEFYGSLVHVCGRMKNLGVPPAIYVYVCVCSEHLLANSVYKHVIINTLNDYKVSFNLTKLSVTHSEISDIFIFLLRPP